MAILVLTIFLSVILAAGFTVAFVHTLVKAPARGMEQQSLLPLADDTCNTPTK